MAINKRHIKSDAGVTATEGLVSETLKNSIERKQAADYIASMGQDLQKLAQSTDLPFLSYLISMVVEEAKSVESEEAQKSK